MAIPAKPLTHAIARENYTVVWWNPITVDINGVAATITGYDIYSGYYLNEYDQAFKVRMTTTDVDGLCDSLYIDLDPRKVLVYRVQARSVDGISEASDRTVATRITSQIDNKLELLDRQLILLDEQGEFDEGILV